MIDSGDVVNLGDGAVVTYLVIKGYVDFEKGISFPSLDTIAVKSGHSKKTVHNHIKKLIEYGYVRKLDTHTKGNVYKLRERVPLEVYNRQSKEKEAVMASWDYVPIGVTRALGDIKKLLVEGKLPTGSSVHIENFSVNIQVNPNAETAIQNLNLDDLINNPQIRAAFERAMKSKGK